MDSDGEVVEVAWKAQECTATRRIADTDRQRQRTDKDRERDREKAAVDL